MTREHIVVLKKIPVDPAHQAALRVGGRGNSVHHLSPRREEGYRDQNSRWLFRIASFLLSLAFIANPVAMAYAEEVTPLPPLENAEGEMAAVPLADDEAAPLEEEEIPAAPSSEDPVVVPDSAGTSTESASGVSDIAHIATTTIATTTEDRETGTTTGQTEGGGAEDDGSGNEHATTTPSESLPEDASATSTDGVTIVEFDSDSPAEAEMPEESVPETEVPAETDDGSQTRLPTPEEIAAEREAAEAAMRIQIREEVKAEIRAQCVSYANDGYYCVDERSSRSISTAPPAYRVTSERNIAGGDADIVVIRDMPEGESREIITDNATDDLFPSADAELRMIAWQSMVDGRWQIAYKEGTGTPQYLTATPFGNGHPATDGKHIVWQSWVNDNWEILYAEPNAQSGGFAGASSTAAGAIEGMHPGWHVERLSESGAHDMFPKIAGNIVTWQEKSETGWNIAVYDLATKSLRIVKAGEGKTGEDPTLAILYKERTPEGVVTLRAKDIVTGNDIPLRESQPQQPARLPIPEQQGALPATNASSTLVTVKPEGEGDAPPAPAP